MHSTALQRVEQVCRNKKVEVSKIENHLLVNAIGQYKRVRYPILVMDSPEGGLTAMVRTDEGAVPVQRGRELAEILTRGLARIITVRFEDEENRFYISMNFDSDEAYQRLTYFVSGCDAVFPLLYHVGKYGAWDDNLVGLAAVPPDGHA